MAIIVLVAVGGIADELVDAIKQRMARLTIGAGTDASSERGPLITAAHRDKVAPMLPEQPVKVPPLWCRSRAPV